MADAMIGITRLGIDTAPVIYFVEENARYDALVVEVFERIRQGSLLGITSVITLGEVLVRPISIGDTRLQEEYRDLLLRSAHFQTLSISPAIAERAAALRSQFRLRMPDALQIAAATDSGCQAFLTNDAGLRRVADIQVLLLDELQL